ncbi:sigma 54-interacting transcriptional regulator [Caballeronia terrestris]|uniref:sigma 54-interacting transcriptional regulator n=1 Tax=Caballeronia terrestris TaxID=1226301 RepID=UPI0035B56924
MRPLLAQASGTGKELTAAAIHERSTRRDQPFVDAPAVRECALFDDRQPRRSNQLLGNHFALLNRCLHRLLTGSYLSNRLSLAL